MRTVIESIWSEKISKFLLNTDLKTDSRLVDNRAETIEIESYCLVNRTISW